MQQYVYNINTMLHQNKYLIKGLVWYNSICNKKFLAGNFIL